MLKESQLNDLRGKRNLLAFSGGVDSTALFFLLQNTNITFDIAIVNYNIREQSLDEVAYAQKLSKQYSLQCYVFNAKIITSSFEATARKIRYDFFEELIVEHSYENLLTAHHLGDRFEWMMMQFCKGAGCIELAGMFAKEERTNYTLIRPLLNIDKSELLTYLHTNEIHYFKDKTNTDKNILRNSFRHQYTQPLLSKYLEGIKKSFHYLDEDRTLLAPNITVHSLEGLSYFKKNIHSRANIIAIDKYLKQKNYLMSANERELLKSEVSSILGRKYLISQINTFIFITPYTNSKIIMKKKFKEECRILKISPKLRPYLHQNETIYLKIKELLRNN